MSDKAKTPEEPTVNWDDSEMISTYANVCNSCSTREEIMLFFGTNQTWNPAQKEVSIKLTNRMVLSPFAAKRLNMILSNVVNEYETNFGPINLDVNQPQSAQTETADKDADSRPN